MKYEAVLFDLDGTLLDTLKDLNAACNYALNFYGYPSTSLEETRLFIGNGIRKLVERSLKGKIEKLDEVLAGFQKYYKQNYNVYTKLYDGVIDILAYCKEKRIPCAIVSNKNQEILSMLYEAYFKEYISVCIGDSKDVVRKPDTQGIELACKRLGVASPNILYVGDSCVDAMTIQNVGCDGILVSYGFGKKEDLQSYGIPMVDSILNIKDMLE